MQRLVVNLRDVRPIWAIPDWALEEIRAALPKDWQLVEVRASADGQGDGGAVSREVLDAVVGAEVYIGYGAPRELVRAATRPPQGCLRWLHTGAAGVRGLLHSELLDSDVVLTNSAGIHAAPIADTVFAMILHFARGLDIAVRAQAERKWAQARFEAVDAPVLELEGTTLGILGLGGIGREVARRGVALGMRVRAIRRSGAPSTPNVELATGPNALPELLRETQFLVVTVPETAETRDLLDRDALRLLPRGAVVLNVARGKVVDEDALADLLAAGHLRGAGLDVFRKEPLPPESRLWTLPNVLILPHVSGTSARFWRRQTDLILDNLRRYLAGETLLNQVDKLAGY